MLGDDAVEVVVVPCFLVVHVFHERAQVRVRPCYDGRLGGVDEDGSQFACLVYAEGRGEELLLCGGEWPDGFAMLLFLQRGL